MTRTQRILAHALAPPIAAMGIALATAETAQAARCKDYTRCEQAVENWCQGRHSRADGDSDGIPCENVCRSKAEADRHRQGRRCPK